ncbi:50S ribosomal protein L10 [Natronospira bacteriovora]|uniref:Large ribosomal subunit protein uL10 n=1 Tax=Natronospira bacteriovora TaxID=3069753 RepID=A0ABU0W932_9GAMM|nr:50S ribosomal protein L10 [Natronospira sp. AB-CW4]MDQ2070549.1 50S ribosomal protein L10 [Natronospira sp. AB-CW4]
MALSFEQKKAMVAEVSEIAAVAHSAVAAEYRGLTVEQMNALRTKAREAGVYLRVVKNNLARRALEGTDFECMGDSLVGPLLLAFSQNDPGSAGRVVKDFAKEHDLLQAKIVSIGGQALPGSELDRLASLPTRDEALAQLMSVMKAPVEKFVRTLNEPHAKLVRTFAAYRDQKQAA